LWGAQQGGQKVKLLRGVDMVSLYAGMKIKKLAKNHGKKTEEIRKSNKGVK
jgi:hypothetical protein